MNIMKKVKKNQKLNHFIKNFLKNELKFTDFKIDKNIGIKKILEHKFINITDKLLI
jgi:hypothetical protein